MPQWYSSLSVHGDPSEYGCFWRMIGDSGGCPLKIVFYILRMTVSVLLGALEILMLIRAVVSWLPIDENSVINRFLYAVTEPVVLPLRLLFYHLGLFQDLPLDIAFFLTFCLLSVLRLFV